MDKYDLEFFFHILVCLASAVTSLIISLCAWMYSSVYFYDVSDSNAHGLGPTTSEVVRDFILSFIAWALATGVVITAMAVFSQLATRHNSDKSLIPTAFNARLAIVCWIILCAGR